MFLARDALQSQVASMSHGGEYREVQARPSDIAVVLWTGGSEGEPKGVLHTHRGLAHKAITMARVHGLRPNYVV